MVESQISLDELGFSNFKRMIDVIIPKKERKQNRMIIAYMRIYTHLVSARALMTKERCNRAIDHLNLAKNIIKQTDDVQEKPYIKRLADTVEPIIKNKEDLIRLVKKEDKNDETEDPYHVQTAILLAQNICILRILKANK
tara:strand:- start:3445 stop:3864 length:420 start_codon:yes stop_codon:yes gene_type:complete